MVGMLQFERLIARYGFAEINRAAADATTGATNKPVLLLPGHVSAATGKSARSR